MSLRAALSKLVLGLALAAWAVCPATAAVPRPMVTTPRLYVLDCGTIINLYPERFGLSRENVKHNIMAVMCYLIVHPKGTLMWDTGLPDGDLGRPLYANTTQGSSYWLKQNSVVRQLADIGFTPDAIDYLSLSHAHHDHSGNANAFHKATWLVSHEEWDVMFKGPLGGSLGDGKQFAQLKTARTKFIADKYDVFGDGSVIIHRAPGHTPGHSVLQVNLKKTGPVILGGDIAHYPEELTRNTMPPAETKTGTPQSRAKILALAGQRHAQLWLAHDLDLFLKLKRAPYYE